MRHEEHPSGVEAVEGGKVGLAKSGGQNHQPGTVALVPCGLQRGESLALNLVRLGRRLSRFPWSAALLWSRGDPARPVGVGPLGRQIRHFGAGEECLETRAGHSEGRGVVAIELSQVPLDPRSGLTV